MRVPLKPGLRRAWRGPDCLQVGIGPRQGTLLAGVTQADAAALDRFVHGVDLPSRGGSAATARQRRLAELLHEAGLLISVRTGRAALGRLGPSRQRLVGDAAVWSLVHPDAGDGWGVLAGRAGRHVAVIGAGRTGMALAGALSGAGVGRVSVSDPRPVTEADLMPGGHRREDLGRRREESAREALSRARDPVPDPSGAVRPGRSTRRNTPGRPDLVVLVRYGVADAGAAEPMVRTDLAHLSVVQRGPDAVVGPLVVPGQGPCLRCLDLHRSDRDPAWPRVLAQLLYTGGRPEEPEESASATLVAGLAALQVLARLDGLHRPASLGATLEVELPDGLVGRRPWATHPACGCHWPPADPVGDPAGDQVGDPVQNEAGSDEREPTCGTTMSG
jgi:bacteriocin biosynthesis cyclodehydratase domain-containing protein